MKKVFIFIFATLSLTVIAEVKLPNLFRHHMVLQRNVNIPVWGWASPGEKIEVSINKAKRAITTKKDGRWMVKLPAMAEGGPFQMKIKGSENQIVIKDILIGEVWLCSGQSNMVFQVRRSSNADKAIAESKISDLRLFNVWKNCQSKPENQLNKGEWFISSPKRTPHFSAVAYFFGKEIHSKLKVPVGIITSAWSGTRIDTWIPKEGYKSSSTLKDIIKNKDSKQKKEENQPSVLFNGMINPLIPFPVRGIIWYQGEGNRGDGMLYADKMKALITSWRSLWHNKDMPFYFVQIAPFKYTWGKPETLPELWEAQNWVAKNIPHTAMAVINDLGDLKDIHPANKAPVGKRLADLALNKTYGMKAIACDSPTFKSLRIMGNKAVVRFANAKGLKTRDGKAPDCFEICGKDGVYHSANATIKRDTVILRSPSVAKPVNVRFAWDMTAMPNLVNAAGMPVGAFRVKLNMTKNKK